MGRYLCFTVIFLQYFMFVTFAVDLLKSSEYSVNIPTGKGAARSDAFLTEYLKGEIFL